MCNTKKVNMIEQLTTNIENNLGGGTFFDRHCDRYERRSNISRIPAANNANQIPKRAE